MHIHIFSGTKEQPARAQGLPSRYGGASRPASAAPGNPKKVDAGEREPQAALPGREPLNQKRPPLTLRLLRKAAPRPDPARARARPACTPPEGVPPNRCSANGPLSPLIDYNAGSGNTLRPPRAREGQPPDGSRMLASDPSHPRPRPRFSVWTGSLGECQGLLPPRPGAYARPARAPPVLRPRQPRRAHGASAAATSQGASPVPFRHGRSSTGGSPAPLPFACSPQGRPLPPL
nr:basic salivary proline-rich protein 4-like [Penaeus vannamei]